MTGLIASDPLALVAIEAGLVQAPLNAGAAQGSSTLDSPQRAAVIGEPVPIVFCRRDEIAGTGGVLVSPGATEARFVNDANNAVTAFYHLVVSEGRIGSIQVRDVFQRSCRVGQHTQTYNRRAGTWQPGNFITAVAGYDMPECPYYCGTGGSYEGMSTLSFQVTTPDGVDLWNRQVHAFVRNGMEVHRLIEGTVGSSNNFADLFYWSLLNAAKLPVAMIDVPSLTTAANFLAVNGFNCDINISDSENLADFVSKVAPYFLLTETRNNGKRGLRSLLPLNNDFTIKTTAISSAFTFTQDHVQPDGLQVQFVDLVDRKPFCVQAIWRQQLTDDFGIIRTSEVRYAGEAENGPFEQHDLSAFSTRETHAVKVAAYIRARRRYITHSARLTCRPLDSVQGLTPGDIVRVTLSRRSDWAPESFHDHLYEINRVSRDSDGSLQFDLTHFPVDDQGRSRVALDVAGAVGAGIMLTSNRTGISCDVNSSADTTVPTEEGTDVEPIDDSVSIPGDGGGGGGGGGGSGGDEEIDPPPEPEASTAALYFHSIEWDDLELVVRIRIAPTGKPPTEELGALFATIGSGLVIALDSNGNPVSPQPSGLPTLTFNGLIAPPWSQISEPNKPAVPPLDRIFQGEFRIAFASTDFPPLQEDPEDNLTYRMPIFITDTTGGFSTVTVLNSAIAFFEAREQEPAVLPLDDAVFYYDFADPACYPGTGTTINDLGPLGNDGAIYGNGVVFSTMAGGCLDFVDRTVDPSPRMAVMAPFVDASLNLDPANGTVAYSQVAWVRFRDVGGAGNDYQTIVNYGNDVLGLFAYDWDLNEPGGPLSFISYNPNVAFDNFESSLEASLGQWHHVAFCYSYPGTAVFYINGTQAFSVATTEQAFANSFAAFSIGAGVYDNPPTTGESGAVEFDEELNGYIGLVGVFHTKLSAENVALLYSQTSARFQA